MQKRACKMDLDLTLTCSILRSVKNVNDFWHFIDQPYWHFFSYSDWWEEFRLFVIVDIVSRCCLIFFMFCPKKCIKIWPWLWGKLILLSSIYTRTTINPIIIKPIIQNFTMTCDIFVNIKTVWCFSHIYFRHNCTIANEL